ncbi:hypothetical protein N7457_004105 [Penicillium paradoxum]|uniref:uncharacterized protein n=1 Tax=Penicillium paradoxum TaxID=176176 RepID=UPI0025484390|nr:uncharacterized protein N7457_004105 [Penicillium paradoxum]KAJ5782331.1 hypothetical protein N7457_004105 [Penicillium paradoxum]
MAVSLPFDTLLQIFSYLPNDVISCACVCRDWQIAAETFTFSNIHVNSANVHDLRRIVSASPCNWRARYVRHIYFKIILLDYDVAARAHLENQEDRDGNNNAFTQSISSLFEILSSWPYDERSQVSLEIYARSPSDWRAEPNWKERHTRHRTGCLFPEKDLLDLRYQSSYLQLTEAKHLSKPKCITAIDISGYYPYRNIAPGAVSEMIAHLPRLQYTDVKLSDSEAMDTLLRDSLRDDFTTSNWSATLRHLGLVYEAKPNFTDTPPSPQRSKPGNDCLCLALHQLSQQLETLSLDKLMIGPELFWPEDANKSAPYWPNLTNLFMSYTFVSTSGAWFFEQRPESEDSPSLGSGSSDISNGLPRWSWLPTKYLDKLYLAAGRAAQHMPRLNGMGLEAKLPHGLLHDFVYVANVGSARWSIDSKFDISTEVEDTWNAAARSHGNDQISIEVTNSGTVDSDDGDI